MLLYDYQFDLAAIITSAAMLLIFFLRQTLPTKSMRLFVTLVVLNLSAAICDLLSIFTISFPEDYNIIYNYAVSLSYLFFYNCTGVVFFLYIDSKARIKKLKLFNKILGCAMILMYFVLIFSSPWTHAVAYFTEDLEYTHGPFMSLLFLIPFLTFMYEIFMVFFAKRHFNRYQRAAILMMIGFTGISVVISFVFPRMLTTCMMIGLVDYFVYMSFENPAHYNYVDTSCYDHNAFLEIIRYRMSRKKVYHAVVFTLNDYDYLRHTRGEKITSKVSKIIADFLYTQFHRNAFALSDEKFIVLVDDQQETSRVRYIIINYFMNPIRVDGQDYRLNISYCTIRDIDETINPEALERLIEFRLTNPDYRASSHDIITEVFDNVDHENHIIHILLDSIKNDAFQVYFQPIYNLKTGVFESAEALVRVYDEELGFVDPEEMIRLAEKNNLISQIGDIVFKKVCQFIHDGELRRRGIKYIEINLSPIHCREVDVVERFQNIMETYGISPSQINFEITETAELENSKRMMMNIERLNSIGISLSIDDYGSGFASADYLLVLPVSIVKIDKTILWNAMDSANAMIVLRNTIHMLHELDKHIVVEGVENTKMVNILSELEVDYLQGFYYSKPLPPNDFLRFIDQNQKEDDSFNFIPRNSNLGD